MLNLSSRAIPRISSLASSLSSFSRKMSSEAIVVGAYQPSSYKEDAEGSVDVILTQTAATAIEKDSVLRALKAARFTAGKGEVRTLFGLPNSPEIVAVVGLGKETKKPDVQVENARVATANGISAIKALAKKPFKIQLDPMGAPQGVSEGAFLSQYTFDHLKAKASQKIPAEVSLIGGETQDWKVGQIHAEAQNLARRLAETPANLMTPTIFCQEAQEALKGIANMTVNVYDKAWAEEKKMGSFLSVAQGSEQPPKFLEVIYKGNPASDKTYALVGKGVTFDSGGISLKPAADMDAMRADMMGSCDVLATMQAIGKLKLPINVVAVAPLTENLPSGRATKPGDVFTAMNGKTIVVNNTDAEGRLILADALTYVTTNYKPIVCIDLATLTGSMDIALGSVYAGVFTNSDELFADLDQAGKQANDRFWRMPLDADYKLQLKAVTADLNNVGGRSAGCCTAAIFLKEFVEGAEAAAEVEDAKPRTAWAHIDIAGVMSTKESSPSYMSKGMMSGRPVRSLINYFTKQAGSQ